MTSSVSGLTHRYVKAVPLVQRSIGFASIGATYSVVGSIFGDPVFCLIIVSTLNENVQISLDGVNDFIPVVANATLVIDIKSDGAAVGGALGVYVKDLNNPTSGSLYVSGFTI